MDNEEQRIDTDGGPYVAGDVGTQGGNFTGRDAIEQQKSASVEGGLVVNINQPTVPRDDQFYQPYRGNIMPSVEQELRGDIKALTVAVLRLEASVDKSNAITKQQIEAIREQSVALEKKFEERLAGMNLVIPPPQLPRWAGYATLAVLTFIAVMLFVLVYSLTRGGV